MESGTWREALFRAAGRSGEGAPSCFAGRKLRAGARGQGAEGLGSCAVRRAIDPGGPTSSGRPSSFESTCSTLEGAWSVAKIEGPYIGAFRPPQSRAGSPPRHCRPGRGLASVRLRLGGGPPRSAAARGDPPAGSTGRRLEAHRHRSLGAHREQRPNRASGRLLAPARPEGRFRVRTWLVAGGRSEVLQRAAAPRQPDLCPMTTHS